MKFNEGLALFLVSFVVILGIMLGIQRWTNVDLAGPIAFFVLSLIGLPIIFIVYLITFNATQLEKKHYGAFLMVFIIIIIFGLMFNKFGLFPELFSAGIKGLQSMMGL